MVSIPKAILRATNQSGAPNKVKKKLFRTWDRVVLPSSRAVVTCKRIDTPKQPVKPTHAAEDRCEAIKLLTTAVLPSSNDVMRSDEPDTDAACHRSNLQSVNGPLTIAALPSSSD
eukprot:scaffold279188_cov21-Tisochrysis_lutea.AAC.1